MALVTDIVGDYPVGIQITALSEDGRKLGCEVLGAKQYGAIKLSPVASVTNELAIAVGIENALSARLCDVNAPVWALPDVEEVAGFAVLPCVSMVEWRAPQLTGIKRLTILASNDVNGACQKAAATARARWEEHGLMVRVRTPRQPGANLNDIVRARVGLAAMTSRGRA